MPALSKKHADTHMRDGKADYLVLDPKTGALNASLNDGPAENTPEKWHWSPIGQVASGLGPGKYVHFADIDGDGVCPPCLGGILADKRCSLTIISSSSHEAKLSSTGMFGKMIKKISGYLCQRRTPQVLGRDQRRLASMMSMGR